jgi:N-acetyl sugar amidotransferase
MATTGICTRCVMDASAPDIRFGPDGVCTYCRAGDRILQELPAEAEGETRLLPVIERAKALGAGREYDVIVGVSGGVDSSYASLLASRHGLRALAVHFDNGWNSELAVENIQRVVEASGFDLMTYVIDWPEFRDLQRAFLKASVIDIEMITDHAITAALVRLADENRIPLILSGTNKATEHGMPPAWTWNKEDWTNIRAIHARFGTVPLRSYPHLTRRRWLAIRGLRRGLRVIDILNHVHYRRDRAAESLARDVGWREYGGKHHESVFTRFYQSWILPTKFGVDKRRVHLSARIRNGEISRDESLAELERPLYTAESLAIEREFVLKKLGFSDAEFDQIMVTPPRSHASFASDRHLVAALRVMYTPMRMASRRRVVRRSSTAS